MTFAEFTIEAGKKAKTFRRDIEELKTMGVTTETLDQFEQKLNTLDSLSTDTEMETLKMVQVEEKNQLAAEIKKSIKKIIIAANQVYKDQISYLNNYNSYDYPNITEKELSVVGYCVARVTKSRINDFTIYGITIEECDRLISMCDEHKEQIFFVNERVTSRDLATEDRWIKAKEAYSEMMRLCEIGKFIWADVSEAHYNDYIVYPNSSSENTDNSSEDNEDDFDGVPEYDFNS